MSGAAVRFAAVGVVNTTIDVGLFSLLHDELGITAANLVSTSAGMAFSFAANGILVFDGARLGWRQSARFVAITGTTMWVLQPVLIHLLLFVGPAPVAKLAATAVTVVLNFLAYRFWVWPTPGSGDRNLRSAAGSRAGCEGEVSLPPESH